MTYDLILVPRGFTQQSPGLWIRGHTSVEINSYGWIWSLGRRREYGTYPESLNKFLKEREI